MVHETDENLATGHQAEPEGRVRQAGGDVMRHVGVLARVRARAVPEGAVRTIIGRQRVQRLISPRLLVVRFCFVFWTYSWRRCSRDSGGAIRVSPRDCVSRVRNMEPKKEPGTSKLRVFFVCFVVLCVVFSLIFQEALVFSLSLFARILPFSIGVFVFCALVEPRFLFFALCFLFLFVCLRYTSKYQLCYDHHHRSAAEENLGGVAGVDCVRRDDVLYVVVLTPLPTA